MAPDAASKQSVTQGKLILIGVLAVVLVGVVYWNYFRDPPRAGSTAKQPAKAGEQHAKRSAPAAARQTAPAAGAQPSRPAQGGGGRPRKPWPKFDLADVIARDPFTLPAAFPQPHSSLASAAEIGEPLPSPSPASQTEAATQERADTLAAMKQQGVQLVLQNGREYVAKIGDRQVRVGDKIGGLRVVDISLRGVVLEGEASP